MYTGNMKSERKASEKITIHKIAGHLRTVREHRALVRKYCFAVGLYRQGLTHDLSKYTPTELINGFRYYEEGKRSPNNREREEKGYSDAWMHHKGRNKHHYEYWYDYESKIETPIIPFKYFLEMLCDTLAAGQTYQGKKWTKEYQLTYWNETKDKTKMNKNMKKLLDNIYKDISINGVNKVLNRKKLKILYNKYMNNICL